MLRGLVFHVTFSCVVFQVACYVYHVLSFGYHVSYVFVFLGALFLAEWAMMFCVSILEQYVVLFALLSLRVEPYPIIEKKTGDSTTRNVSFCGGFKLPQNK